MACGPQVGGRLLGLLALLASLSSSAGEPPSLSADNISISQELVHPLACVALRAACEYFLAVERSSSEPAL